MKTKNKLRVMPKYDLDKIRFGTDGPTFEKAVELYGAGKVTKFKEEISSYSATVVGTKPYRVFVEARCYDCGQCECYLGQNDTLCKHMVALAIMAVRQGEPLTTLDKRVIEYPTSSGRLGELSKEKVKMRRKEITAALRYIKAYNGPSRIWFRYQDSLSEGCRRLSALVTELPVSVQTARLLVNLLLRLDKKLCTGGVDDSNGTVGSFMTEVVVMLEDYAKLDQRCVEAFCVLRDKETCFEWEEPLIRRIKK